MTEHENALIVASKLLNLIKTEGAEHPEDLLALQVLLNAMVQDVNSLLDSEPTSLYQELTEISRNYESGSEQTVQAVLREDATYVEFSKLLTTFFGHVNLRELNAAFLGILEEVAVEAGFPELTRERITKLWHEFYVETSIRNEAPRVQAYLTLEKIAARHFNSEFSAYMTAGLILWMVKSRAFHGEDESRLVRLYQQIFTSPDSN